jgi:cytochrome c oxidase subunit 2
VSRALRWTAVVATGSAVAWLLFRALSADRFMPPAASAEAAVVDQAFDEMLRITIPIYAAVIAALLVAVTSFRARRRDAGDPAGTNGGGSGAVLQAVWVLASVILTLRLAAYGIREYRLLDQDGAAELDVQVHASQWSWEFYYPAERKYGSALFLPLGRRVRLLMTSADVVHSFWVPAFRLKMDVLPGRVTKLLVTPTRAGDYLLQCAELCGQDHTIMTARVSVLPPDKFAAALAEEF